MRGGFGQPCHLPWEAYSPAACMGKGSAESPLAEAGSEGCTRCNLCSSNLTGARPQRSRRKWAPTYLTRGLRGTGCQSHSQHGILVIVPHIGHGVGWHNPTPSCQEKVGETHSSHNLACALLASPQEGHWRWTQA